MHARAVVRDDLATDRPLATNEMADFGAHPYKRSSGLARGLCDSLAWLRQRRPSSVELGRECSFPMKGGVSPATRQTAATDDEQTSVLVFDRHLLLRASGRLRLRRGLGRCVAQVPLGGNRGGNQVGTNRVPSWPLMSPRVTPENGGVQAIPRGERGARLLGRPPTEPKVTGSNPVGRAPRTALQSDIRGIVKARHRRVGAGANEMLGWSAAAAARRPATTSQSRGSPVLEPGALALSRSPSPE
jgi:hypothetical protein